MAEYYNAKHIAEFMRGYVKHESRRIRLCGVRARVVIFSIDSAPALTCMKAFSWADITVVIKRLKGNFQSFKSEIISAAYDDSVHGIIITDTNGKLDSIAELCDLVPQDKDVLCTGAPAVSSFFKGKGEGTCSSAAIVKMLDYADVEYKGKNVALIGDHCDVRVLSYVLFNKGARVILCPSASKETAKICSSSDILVTWQGNPSSVTSDYVNERQVIIDVNDTPDCNIPDIEPYIHGIFLGAEKSFSELCDYIATEKILKCAAKFIN